MSERPFSDEELDAAVRALEDRARLQEAQDVVTRAAPQLGGVLEAALREGGWFGQAHDEQVLRAATSEDVAERIESTRALIAEETRLGMLVGVAVGYALARELHP